MKKSAAQRGAFSRVRRSYSEKLDEMSSMSASTGLLLVGSVGDEVDCGALHDAKREDTQQAFRIYSALILFHPDGALKFIGLLNEERGGSGVETYLIVHDRLFDIHCVLPLKQKHCLHLYSIPNLCQTVNDILHKFPQGPLHFSQTKPSI